MIFGPFIIIIVNNYGPAQAPEPTQSHNPKTEIPPKKHNENMHYIHCDRDGCEWDGEYDTPGKAGQALGVHRSWCVKGKPLKKRPFGDS